MTLFPSEDAGDDPLIMEPAKAQYLKLQAILAGRDEWVAYMETLETTGMVLVNEMLIILGDQEQ